jgi:outer membrane protein assembly factor BamB
MKSSDLIFVGIKGSVVAVNRASGKQVWATHLKGSDFVNVVLQGDSVLATCRGELFCLDPLTGQGRWHNPLKGFGMGLATIAGNGININSLLLAETRRRDEEVAASGAAVAAAA